MSNPNSNDPLFHVRGVQRQEARHDRHGRGNRADDRRAMPVRHTTVIWFAIAAMIVFSVGEMLSSPKFSEFLGNIAPPDKKAMWIGFSQAPILIGWTIEGKVGLHLYHIFSSKDVFARQMLVERGMSPALVTEEALPIGEAFKKLVEFTGDSPETLTRLLYDSHHVGLTWCFFGAVGLLSAIMIHGYGRWIMTLAKKERSAQA